MVCSISTTDCSGLHDQQLLLSITYSHEYMVVINCSRHGGVPRGSPLPSPSCDACCCTQWPVAAAVAAVSARGPCNSYGGWPSDRCLPLTKVSIPQQSLGMFCAWRLPHFDVGHSCGPQQSVTAGLLYDIRVRLLQQLLLLPPPTSPPPPPRDPAMTWRFHFHFKCLTS